MTRGCIMGISLSGKTTLAKHIAKGYNARKVKAIVLDINREKDWPENCEVFADTEKFWQQVWATTGRLVIVDESAETIARDKKFIPVFTRLRHLNHILLIISHNGTDMLPVMRQQMDTLYLFRVPNKTCQLFAETFADERIFESNKLNQYEYLYAKLYHAPKKYKLQPFK